MAGISLFSSDSPETLQLIFPKINSEEHEAYIRSWLVDVNNTISDNDLLLEIEEKFRSFSLLRRTLELISVDNESDLGNTLGKYPELICR